MELGREMVHERPKRAERESDEEGIWGNGGNWGGSGAGTGKGGIKWEGVKSRE